MKIIEIYFCMILFVENLIKNCDLTNKSISVWEKENKEVLYVMEICSSLYF